MVRDELSGSYRLDQPIAGLGNYPAEDQRVGETASHAISPCNLREQSLSLQQVQASRFGRNRTTTSTFAISGLPVTPEDCRSSPGPALYVEDAVLTLDKEVVVIGVWCRNRCEPSTAGMRKRPASVNWCNAL